MQFGLETIDQVRGEIEPLLRQHWEEIAMFKEEVELAPDWGRYIALERDRALAIYTVRNEGKLVGYAVFIIHYMLHYKHTLAAANDILWLAPEYRNAGVGGRFIAFCEEDLREREVDVVSLHIKKHFDFRPLVHPMGYQDAETIVVKLLKGEQ